MKVSGARYGSAPLFDRPTTQLTRIEWSVDGSATEVKIAVAAKFLWQFFKWVSFSQRPKDGNHKLLQLQPAAASLQHNVHFPQRRRQSVVVCDQLKVGGWTHVLMYLAGHSSLRKTGGCVPAYKRLLKTKRSFSLCKLFLSHDDSCLVPCNDGIALALSTIYMTVCIDGISILSLVVWGRSHHHLERHFQSRLLRLKSDIKGDDITNPERLLTSYSSFLPSY